MSKASKLARAQKNVPAVSQRILTKANRLYNNSTTTTNTSSPVENTAGANDAFWLVEEATDASTPPNPGVAMHIDDLNLTYHTSHVRLTMNANFDSSSSNVNSVFKLQRSSNGGASWSDVSVAEQFSNRISATTQIEHGGGDRNMGRGGFCIIDTNPGTLTPQYRVLITTLSGFYVYLNRDYNTDNPGPGIGTQGTLTAVARTVSTFTAEEIINY